MSRPEPAEGSSIGRRRALARRERNASWLERRAQILAAAAEAFRANGFQGVSMNDIAQRLGGDRASVYYYFSSKQEIFFALVEEATEANALLAEEAAAAPGSAAERLRRAIESTLESYERHFPYLLLYIQEDMRRVIRSDSPGDQYLRELGERYDKALKKIAADGHQSGEFRSAIDPQMLKFLVLGAINWTHRWFTPGGRLTAAEVAHSFCDIILSGIVSDPASLTTRGEERAGGRAGDLPGPP